MKVVSVKVPESVSERDVRVGVAIEALLKGAVSVGKAAEIADLAIQELLVELKKRGVQAYPYGDEEALQELQP